MKFKAKLEEECSRKRSVFQYSQFVMFADFCMKEVWRQRGDGERQCNRVADSITRHVP